MLNYFLLCSCIVPTLLGAPIPVAQNDVISHIVIVTPQAQVHLEPAIKYDTSAFIHHLSPLARILSPHDDTILYVPANPAAPIIPVENISVGRANIKEQLQKLETKQWDQISQQIQQAVQTGSSQLGPQLSEAATAASSAAAAAGQGLFPALFPPGGSSSSNTASKEDKQTIESLLTSNARVYALTPAVSHVVDFVQSPLFIGPISAIRTRSIKESEITQSSAASELEAKKIDEIHFKDNVKTFDDAVKTQPQQERQRNLKVDPLEKNKELTENDNNEQMEKRNGNKLQQPIKEEHNQEVILHQSTQLKNSEIFDGNGAFRENMSESIISKIA